MINATVDWFVSCCAEFSAIEALIKSTYRSPPSDLLRNTFFIAFILPTNTCQNRCRGALNGAGPIAMCLLVNSALVGWLVAWLDGWLVGGLIGRLVRR